jgi:hypothetical protein
MYKSALVAYKLRNKFKDAYTKFKIGKFNCIDPKPGSLTEDEGEE